MKNKKLWIVFLITIGVVFLLTWIIPSTITNESGALVVDKINPVGIWDLFYYLSLQLAWFFPTTLFLIFTAIFYGVVNKTGALRYLTEKITSLIKNKEKIFVILLATFIIILTSLTGISYALMFFVPFLMAVLLSIGFSKVVSLISIIGSILLGYIGTFYATSLYLVIASYVEPGITYGVYKLVLVILGILVMGLYLYFCAKILKGKEKEEIDESILFIEKIPGKKKVKLWPIITALSVILGMFILGLTPWVEMYKLDIFTNFYNFLIEFELFGFPIFKSILGVTTPELGTWSLTETSILIAIVTFVMALIYKVKWDEVYDGIVSGIKKFLPTILFVTLASMTFTFLSQTGILTTIVNFIMGLTNGFNLFTYSLVSFLGAAFVNETYITNYVTGAANTVLQGSIEIPLLVFIQQTMFGLAMLITPVSIYLLTGLAYFEIEYSKWLKNIWKILLAMFIVVMITLYILMLL